MNVRHAAATIWGSILITIGLGLVVYQFATQSAPSPPSFTQKLETSETGLAVETHYPGIELIVIGAFLVVVGEFRQKPK